MGLPFLLFGLGFAGFKVGPELFLWQAAKHWSPGQGELLSYRLTSSRSREGGTSYEIQARYRYQAHGQTYTGNRVGLHQGKDNIGDYHQRWQQRLARIKNQGDPLPLWYDPGQPDQALLDRELRWGLMALQLAFAVVFSLVGVGLIVAGLRGRQPASKTEATEPGSAASANPTLSATSTPSINSAPSATTASAGPIAPVMPMGPLSLWGFALVWNLIAWPACWLAGDELAAMHQPRDYLLLLIVLFPVVGLFLLWQAIKGSILHRRYGRSRLRLDPDPGQAGGQVGGEIRLSRPLPTGTRFQVQLQCLRSREERGAKGQRRLATSVEWQDQAEGEGRLSNGRTRVPFVFDVPAALPATEPRARQWHHWQLHLAAELPGLDLALDFPLPVVKGTDRSGISIAGRERRQQLQRAQQLTQVLNLEQQGKTLYLQSRYGREVVGSLLAALFGALFLGVAVGIGWADLASGWLAIPVKLLFCTVFGGLGLLIFLLGATTPLSRLETAIDPENLHVRRFLAGWEVYRRRIPLADIRQLQAHKNSSYGQGQRIRNWYQLRVRHGGRTQTIAESIPGRVLADAALTFLRDHTGLP